MSLTVLFDDRCGKCRRFVAFSSALDFAGVIGLSAPRLAGEFGHFDLDALNFEIHVIDSRNHVFRGFFAIRRIALEVSLMCRSPLLFLPGAFVAGVPIRPSWPDSMQHWVQRRREARGERRDQTPLTA